jgi:predicted metal-binding protein
MALSSPGAWSYIFGDQNPGASAGEIMECASLYIRAADGFMPREQRPKSLRAAILGRVPAWKGGC